MYSTALLFFEQKNPTKTKSPIYFTFTAAKLANSILIAHQRTIKTSKGSYLDLGYLKSIS
jgi:hypothetical protein